MNHIDGDRTNNAIWNLEFMTPEENKEHAYAMGLMHRPVKVKNLDTGEVYRSLQEAGRKLGYTSSLQVPRQFRDGKTILRRGAYRLIVVQ